MAKIYISSTYEDLKDCRQAVHDILRKMRHDVIAMEDYVATDQRPLNKCLTDVATCDVYVGIFAWRYGYIPPKENPEQRSITEHEFREAVKIGKPCLVFLLHHEAPWPYSCIENGRGAERLKAFRTELAINYTASFFHTTGELAGLVSVAVSNWENTRTPLGIDLAEQSEKETKITAAPDQGTPTLVDESTIVGAIKGAVVGAIGLAIAGAIVGAIVGAIGFAIGLAVIGAIGFAIGFAIRGISIGISGFVIGFAIGFAIGLAIRGVRVDVSGFVIVGAIGGVIAGAIGGAIAGAIGGIIADASKSFERE